MKNQKKFLVIFNYFVHPLIFFHSTGNRDSPDTAFAVQNEATTTAEAASPQSQQNDDLTLFRAGIKDPKPKFPTGIYYL